MINEPDTSANEGLFNKNQSLFHNLFSLSVFGSKKLF